MVRTPDGIDLHCVVLGDGPAGLIAPGVGNEADFAPLADGRTVGFFDIRNRGRSDPVPAAGAVGIPAEVDDIDTVRRSFGADRVDVIGWSYVALVAALYAARYPTHVRRLVLVCPVPLVEHPAPAPSPEVLAQLAALADQDLDPVAYTRALRRITIPTRMADPAAFARLQSDPSPWPNEHPDRLLRAIQRVSKTLPPAVDHRPELRTITTPTLLVTGDADPVAPPPTIGEWTAALPHATHLPLPDVGHYPHVESPTAFFPAVDAFLRSG